MKRGVFLVNLGTPTSPSLKNVFDYLSEFLTDPRVMDLPWIKRQLLVRGFIVPTRFKQSAKQYRHLWTNEGSPLLFYGKLVQEKLQASLGKDYQIELGMRYQFPSIQEGLEKFRLSQVDELVILPLFPHYASATTGSVFQKVMEVIGTWNIFPKLIFINHYFNHPSLIKAFTARAKQYDLSHYDHLLFSFHGLPERQIQKCDLSKNCLSKGCCQQIGNHNRFCYKAQCYATAEGIASELNLKPNDYSICFQSRLGKDPWIQPYLSDEIQNCAKKGYKRILVLSPSFICDCLETTCEISIEYDQAFKGMGGELLQLVEGLNGHPLWIEALHQLVIENQSKGS